MVKNLPTVQDTRFRSLGWEDALEKEMATHSSILPWGKSMDIGHRSLGGGGRRGATVHGFTRVGHNLVTKTPPPPLSTLPLVERRGL